MTLSSQVSVRRTDDLESAREPTDERNPGARSTEFVRRSGCIISRLNHRRKTVSPSETPSLKKSPGVRPLPGARNPTNERPFPKIDLSVLSPLLHEEHHTCHAKQGMTRPNESHVEHDPKRLWKVLELSTFLLLSSPPKDPPNFFMGEPCSRSPKTQESVRRTDA